MLALENVEAGYGRALVVLRGVSLAVPEGEIVALLGSNGAGKSTLLKTVMGLLPDEPRQGRVRLAGADVSRHNPEAKARAGLALVPEGRGVFPELTVLENLRLGAYHRREPKGVAEDLERVHDLFPRLLERTRQHAGTLSGGEQQMVAIGRAMMARPRLLMLDEPSLGLAPRLVAEIFRVIAEVNRSGVTVLLVEQNARLSLEVAHRGYVLESGRVVLEGTAAELRENENVRELYLGAAGEAEAPVPVGRRRRRRWG